MIKCTCDPNATDDSAICIWHRQLYDVQATVTALLTALEQDFANNLPTGEEDEKGSDLPF